jgi:hypothetical protein
MSKYEQFFRWVVEDNKISIAELFKMPLMGACSALIGLYERWKAETDRSDRVEFLENYIRKTCRTSLELGICSKHDCKNCETTRVLKG